MLWIYCASSRWIFSLAANQVRLSRSITPAIYRCSSSSPFADLIHNVDVSRYLNNIKQEHERLKEQEKSRYNHLLPIVMLLNRKSELQSELNGIDSLLAESEGDMKKLATDERDVYLKKINSVNADLINILLGISCSETDRDVILEVTAGVGGREAMLFAGELFNMYTRYATYKKWDFTLDTVDTAEGDCVRHSSAFVSGRSAMTHLLQEVGIHRVQRVPATERSGRIHTSTVSVSVLIQPSEVEVNLNDKDLKFETKTSSGPGGQHVNKTESCVRLTHIPTGIVVENQTDRSQIQNRKLALQRLRTKLYQMQIESQINQSKATKKEQVGSSHRSEKVRTYNFNQDRVTDHRLGASVHNLQAFLQGGSHLDDIVMQLVTTKQRKDLLNFISLNISTS